MPPVTTTSVKSGRRARDGGLARSFAAFFGALRTAGAAAGSDQRFAVSVKTPLEALDQVRSIPPALESAVIERGLSASVAWRPLESLGLTGAELARVVGISQRTMERKEAKSESLPVAEADRTMRLMRIASEAADALGDVERALAWLRSPSRFLGGKTPLKTIETEAGVALVRQSLGAIAYGGVG